MVEQGDRELRAQAVTVSAQDFLEESTGRAPSRARTGIPYALTAPATLFVALALGGPLLLMFRYSFNRFKPGELMEAAATLDNYAKFFADGFYRNVLFTTLAVSALSTAICLVAGFPVAYFLVRFAGPRWKARLLILIILPLLMGNAVRTAAWMVILGNKGMLAAALEALTPFAAPRLMYSATAVVIGLVSVSLPFMIVTLQSVIERIDETLEQAAESLGASHVAVLTRVTLPLALPGVLAGTMLCFTLCMNAYATPVLIGGPQFKMMAPEVYQQVAKAMDWPFGSALAFLLMAVTLLLTSVATALAQSRYRRWSEP